MKKKFIYGSPLDKAELPSPKRLPQYDECLREFVSSGSDAWKVDKASLPSKDERVILSSLKWRTRGKLKEFGNIHVFMKKKEIYLEKVKPNQ
jgi:hypothetical protein